MRLFPRLRLAIPLTNSIRYDSAGTEPAYKPQEFAGPLPTADVPNPRIFTGSCHCGNVSIAVKAKPLPSKGQTLPEIRGPGSPFSEHAEYVQECSCSICMRVCSCLLHRNFAFHISLPFLLSCCNINVSLSWSNLTFRRFRMARSSSIPSDLKSPSQTRAAASRYI